MEWSAGAESWRGRAMGGGTEEVECWDDFVSTGKQQHKVFTVPWQRRAQQPGRPHGKQPQADSPPESQPCPASVLFPMKETATSHKLLLRLLFGCCAFLRRASTPDSSLCPSLSVAQREAGSFKAHAVLREETRCSFPRAETGFTAARPTRAVPWTAKGGGLQAGRQREKSHFWHRTSALLKENKCLCSQYHAALREEVVAHPDAVLHGGQKAGPEPTVGDPKIQERKLPQLNSHVDSGTTSEKQQLRVMLQREERGTREQRVYVRSFTEQKNDTGNGEKNPCIGKAEREFLKSIRNISILRNATGQEVDEKNINKVPNRHKVPINVSVLSGRDVFCSLAITSEKDQHLGET